MKARNQLLLIFFSAITILIATTFVLLSAISKKNNVFLEAGYNDLKKEAGKVVAMKSNVLENWVYDNSFWNELMTAFKQKDTTWVTANLIPGMDKFNSDCIWLVNADGSLFYNSAGTDDVATGNRFFMQLPLLFDSLKKNPFKHFYVQLNNETIEIFTAPVQAGTDSKRLTTPTGYYIAGQRLNKKYIANLSEKDMYQLIPADAFNNDSIVKENSLVNHYIQLNDFYDRPFRLIKVSKKMEVLNTYKKDLRNYLVIFIVVVLAIALVLFIFFKNRIIYPLNMLSLSLAKKNDRILSKLKSKKNEFGELAGLISDFFLQNDVLKEEINTRVKSEIALKKAASELELATIDKIRAEQAHLAKTEFLSTMSHEIRTPINGVIGVCNLLMEEKLTKQQTDYVNILNFSSRHLLSIVSDILDFSKIESGNLQFDKTSFDLKKTCRNVIELYDPRAGEKGLQLLFEPDENAPFSLYGDSVRLCQVITNLLSNAIKFTHKGSVILGYKTISETDAHTTIQFTVKDTGIGISNDKIDDIFEKFTQADQSTSSNYGGTGLGLTISKKLVELQGGKMDVISEPGKGSEFIFYLSFEKHVYVGSLPVPEKTANKKNLQGLKVLIAEDNKINAQVLSGFLKKWQVNFEIVGNGSDAVERLAHRDFDLILMDLQMPVMDGKEATLAIRNKKTASYFNIPIIALTADATSETQNTIDQYGFNQYLAKPFNPDALYRLLKKYYDVYAN
jgi:signal transduction histidine kinase/CheY-like chemotaxis protein